MKIYKFGRNNQTNAHIEKLVFSFFHKYGMLVAKPRITITPSRTLIQVFFYSSDTFICSRLSATLSSLLSFLLLNIMPISIFSEKPRADSAKASKTLELQLINLKSPILDSYVFAQYINENIKEYSFKRIVAKLRENIFTTTLPAPKVLTFSSRDENIAPAKAWQDDCTKAIIEGVKESAITIEDKSIHKITGLKVILSGRLTTQRAQPRQTIQSVRLGYNQDPLIQNTIAQNPSDTSSCFSASSQMKNKAID